MFAISNLMCISLFRWKIVYFQVIQYLLLLLFISNNLFFDINVRVTLSTPSVRGNAAVTSHRWLSPGNTVYSKQYSSGFNSRKFPVMPFEQKLIYSQLSYKKTGARSVRASTLAKNPLKIEKSDFLWAFILL
jgi:hypothetical protein